MQIPRTKRHSDNAVAARARNRMERAQVEPVIERRRVPVPRRTKADFIIRIEDRFGERVQVSAFRYLGKVRLSTGQSARQFCRGLEHLLAKSA